jgi:hypothetical protein
MRALAGHVPKAEDAGPGLEPTPRVAGLNTAAVEGPAPVAALALSLGLAALGLLAVAVGLVPSRVYFRASGVVRSRVLADMAYRMASSRGEVALMGVATLIALAIAFLLVQP